MGDPQANRTRIISFLFVLSWILVLPAIPWHDYKGFYIQWARIEPSTSLVAVREQMASYHLQYDRSRDGSVSPEALAFTFHPSLSRSADWCRVYGDHVVTRVEFLAD
ncbi:MAG: hypothetical protein AAF430_18510 [Myxococcota bacterium]